MQIKSMIIIKKVNWVGDLLNSMQLTLKHAVKSKMSTPFTSPLVTNIINIQKTVWESWKTKLNFDGH